MKFTTTITAAAGAFIAFAAIAMQQDTGYASKHDDTKLIAALPKSMHTLEAGIRQAAAKAPESAISAKFELDDKGELSLSVYIAQKGLSVDAEHNVLEELSGSPTSEKWATETEVFKDVEHVARSAEQLTIVALSKMSLVDAVAKAQKDQPGTVYSVTPTMRDRKAVFVVQVAVKDKPVELVYDALTGNALKK